MPSAALDELCEGPGLSGAGCDQQATHLEGGKPLCDSPKCKTTKQTRFDQKTFTDFEPEECAATAVRHLPIPANAPEPKQTKHHIHSTQCKMYRVFPAPPRGCAGCICAMIEENMEQRRRPVAPKKEKAMSLEVFDKTAKESHRTKTDPLANLDLPEALKLFKEGFTTAKLAAHFKIPSWHFYQSPRWIEAKRAVTPVRPKVPKVDKRAGKKPRAIAKAITETRAALPKNTRDHLKTIAFAMENKIQEWTKALMDLRSTLAILDKYPDIF